MDNIFRQIPVDCLLNSSSDSLDIPEAKKLMTHALKITAKAHYLIFVKHLAVNKGPCVCPLIPKANDDRSLQTDREFQIQE